MFECSVCGLHFISGASCPSCGSTVAKDLEQGEELPSHDSHSMPGLDDLAESIGDEPFDDETPQTIESSSTLPFGMGAESSVSTSSLPFGIGSNVSEVDDEQSSIPASIQMVEEVAERRRSSEPEPELEPASEQEFEPELEPASEQEFELASEPEFELEFELESDAKKPLGEPESELELDQPESEQAVAKNQMMAHTERPVKLTATAIVEERPQIKVEAIGISQSSAADSAEDEVPEIWRIDALEADLDSIYQEEEKIIEVEFEDTFNVSEVAVDLDNIHQQAPEVIPELAGLSSPELHPARAMEVNTNGSPELEDYLTNGFACMAKEDWDQAARNFQRLAQQIPSDAAVLNNYGLALLQKAIQMEGSSDASTVSLSETQFESAIMALRQAAKIDPAKDDLILNLSHALLVSGRSEKSLGIVRVFRERQPNDVEGINIEAAALLQLGRFDEARRMFSAAADDPLVKANLERVPSAMA